MASSVKVTSSYPANSAALEPLAGIRPQIQDLRTENIAVLAQLAANVGDVIPLWYGEGDITTPAFIRDAASASLEAGNTFYVPNMRGLGVLNEALSIYQSGIHGRDIPIDRTTVTPGGMQSVLLAMELVVDLGTNVVYFTPQWPNIHNAIHLVGGEPRPVPMTYDTDFRLDLDRVFAACDARTRAICFSTPCNPTGWTATPAELQALLDFSRRTGIWLICDEVYNRLYFEGRSAPSILQIAEDGDRVLSVNSFSKAWAMTGWRVGWLTHPSDIADQVAAMTQYINSGTAAFVQSGAHAAMTQGEPLVEEIRTRVKTGLDLAYDRLSKVEMVILPEKPRGGMYAFFQLRGETDSKRASARLIEQARVGLSPGYLFGDASKSFLRMCVFREPRQIELALERIVAALG